MGGLFGGVSGEDGGGRGRRGRGNVWAGVLFVCAVVEVVVVFLPSWEEADDYDMGRGFGGVVEEYCI